MEKTGGNVLFIDFSADCDLQNLDLFGYKAVVLKDVKAEMESAIGEKLGDSAVQLVVSSVVLDSLDEKKSAVVDKKSFADLYRTFSDKDSECYLIQQDDGSRKVKLISGSLSKSYQL